VPGACVEIMLTVLPLKNSAAAAVDVEAVGATVVEAGAVVVGFGAVVVAAEVVGTEELVPKCWSQVSKLCSLP